MSKPDRITVALRVHESLMRDIYAHKANESLNSFICRAVKHYCGELERKEIDKQFEGMNARGIQGVP